MFSVLPFVENRSNLFRSSVSTATRSLFFFQRHDWQRSGYETTLRDDQKHDDHDDLSDLRVQTTPRELSLSIAATPSVIPVVEAWVQVAMRSLAGSIAGIPLLQALGATARAGDLPLPVGFPLKRLSCRPE